MIIHFYLIPISIILITGLVVFIVRAATFKLLKNREPLSFEEMITIMTVIIKTEIEIYEHSIFRHKGAITNANYENFYHDLTDRIFSALPDAFFDDMSRYLSKEETATLICEKVHSYLQEKATKIQ